MQPDIIIIKALQSIFKAGKSAVIVALMASQTWGAGGLDLTPPLPGLDRKSVV